MILGGRHGSFGASRAAREYSALWRICVVQASLRLPVQLPSDARRTGPKQKTLNRRGMSDTLIEAFRG